MYIPKCYPALRICGAAVTATGVILLQHVTSYAESVREQLSLCEFYSSARIIPDALRSAAAASGLVQLDAAEHSFLNALAASCDYTPAAHPPKADAVPEPVPERQDTPDCFPVQNAVTCEPQPSAPASAATPPIPAQAVQPASVLPLPAAEGEQPAGAAVQVSLTDTSPPAPAAVQSSPTEPASGDTPSVPSVRQDVPSTDSLGKGAVQQVLTADTVPPMHIRILMLGDSLMEDLGPLLYNRIRKYKGMEVIISAKFSTGLCRPDKFSWPDHLRKVLTDHKPDMVVFFLGANDAMSVKEGSRYVPTGGTAWREAYKRKMDELIKLARDAGADVFWIEMPAVGGKYNRPLHETQIAQREYCEQNGTPTMQTDPLFSGTWGKFEMFGEYQGRTVRLRTKDVTHLTPAGNRKLIDHLLPLLHRRMSDFYRDHPERAMSAEEAAAWRPKSAVFTCTYKK